MRRPHGLNLLLQLTKQRVGRAQLGPKVIPGRRVCGTARRVLVLLTILAVRLLSALLGVRVAGLLSALAGVGVPCAVAVKQVLDGKIAQRGILAPMTPEICTPLMVELEKEYGITMVEKTLL